jgi:hypothetical protein
VLIFGKMILDPWLGKCGFIAYIKATAPNLLVAMVSIIVKLLACEKMGPSYATQISRWH